MSVVSKPSSTEKVISFAIKWTPRAIAVAIGGYYGLGIAYELGLMALIDKLAIPIIGHFVGYAGIGAFMPTFQWYAAWAARITIGFAVGVIYDLLEKGVKFCYYRLKSGCNEPTSCTN